MPSRSSHAYLFSSIVAAILFVGLPRRAMAQSSTYLWEALDSTSYDYDVTVLADTDGTYKAYWCATEGAPESEGVFYQQSNAPWNFFPPGQQYALRTTGVRIARLRNVDTNERWDRAMQFDVGIAANYQTDRTLGFLRRERHDASGATIELWECTIGADHFITAFKDYECAGLSAVKLGYAYTTGGPGLSPRYRCRNRGNGEHMTTTDPLCESDAFVLEGAVGNWRDGTMYTHPVDGTWEVSPFGDGAYLCPNSVIKDTDNIYYMAYTASPHYGNGGPFNQLFLATSVDGVTFRPIVDAAGLPRPLATYTSDYPNLLLAADAPPGRPAGQPATRDHIANAFGVGAGQLMKIGGAYRLYYMDSSRYIAASAPGCPNHIGDPGKPATNFRMVRRTASSLGDLINHASEPGECVTAIDQAGGQAGDQQSIAGAKVVHDEATGLSWLFQGGSDGLRLTVWWARSGDTSGTSFFVNGPHTGPIADTSGVTHRVPSGLFRYRFGTVSSIGGWYVYLGHSHRDCHPEDRPNDRGDNSCGLDHAGVTLFQP